MRIEVEQEADGRWIAEVADLSGVKAYGAAREEAIRKAKRWPYGSWRTGWNTASRFLN